MQIKSLGAIILLSITWVWSQSLGPGIPSGGDEGLSSSNSQGISFQSKQGVQKYFAEPAISSISDYQGVPTYQTIEDSLYEVGPGDVLSVYVGKYHSVAVNPEGLVQIANFAPIQVSSLSLKEAKAKILNALKSKYNQVSIHISLLRMKRFKVEVVGEIHYPQSFVVEGATRIIHLLRVAGGFTPLSNRQYVTIQSRDGSKRRVDIGSYRQENPEQLNPILKMGDRVIVHEVNFDKPMARFVLPEKSLWTTVYYQQVDEPITIKKALNQLQNFQSFLFFNTIKVTNKNKQITTRSFVDMSNYEIQEGDVVEFQNTLGQVFIGGAVAKTTAVPYMPGYTVENYLYQSGVRVETGNLGRYTLKRNGKKVSKNTIKATGVLPGDLIYIDSDLFYHLRDYLGLFATTASLVISSLTAYTILNN